MDLLKDRLNQIIKEMLDSKNYYVKPEDRKALTIVMPGKQAQWISRLSMILEDLKCQK